MKTFALLLIGFALPLIAAGCGSSTASEPYNVASYQGTIDTSLPRALQDKQFTVFRLLNGMREGIGEIAALRLFVPGVDFREPFDAFYEGHKRLVRWEFNGPPSGNDVPVVLYFDEQELGAIDPDKLTRVERVYTVTGGGQYSTVTRR
jgi:hypothetical protein